VLCSIVLAPALLETCLLVAESCIWRLLLHLPLTLCICAVTSVHSLSCRSTRFRSTRKPLSWRYSLPILYYSLSDSVCLRLLVNEACCLFLPALLPPPTAQYPCFPCPQFIQPQRLRHASCLPRLLDSLLPSSFVLDRALWTACYCTPRWSESWSLRIG